MRHFSFTDGLFPSRMIWVSAGPSAAPQAAVAESGDTAPEPEFTKENVDRAAAHFGKFFEEIGKHVIEREDLVEQLALALISGQHVAIIGHPGTAKSTVARMVLDRIVDDKIVDDKTGEPKTSLFDKQLTADMRTGEIIGYNLPRTNPETGEMTLTRQVDKGIAPKRFALLDEGFDAPPTVLRGALLSVLLDREIPDGNEKHPAALKTAVLTSNKTLEELGKKYGTELDALLDRFPFLFWTTKRTRRPDSNSRIIKQRAARRSVTTKDPRNKLGLDVPPMTFSEMGLLKKVVDYVRERMRGDTDLLELAKEFYNKYHQALDQEDPANLIKGRRSKIESPRSMNMLVDLLPAIAVLRYIQNPGTPLAVMPEDFEKLRLFFMMRGPVPRDIPDRASMNLLGDKEDEHVLGRLRTEEDVFRRVYTAVVAPAVTHRARSVPRDLASLTTLVNGAFDKVTQQPPTLDLAATTTEIHVLAGRLDQLETLSGQIPTGEELYVKAVSTFLYLLAHAVELGDSGTARHAFRDSGQKHVEKLQTSLFRSEIEKSFTKFKEAMRQHHATGITRQKPVVETMLHHDEARDDEAILGGEVGDIREAIREACLATLGDAVAYAALIQPEEIALQARECGSLVNFQKVMEKFGLKGKVPFEKLVQNRTLTLKFLADFLERLKAVIPAATGADRETLIDYANEISGLYEEVLADDDFSIPEKDRFPEELIRAFVQRVADARAAAAPGSTVKVDIITGNGDPNTVSVRYTITGHEEKTIDPAAFKQEFAEHAQAQLFADDRALIARPAFQTAVAALLKEFKTYLGADWDPSFEELILNTIAAGIRSCLNDKKDTWIICQLEKKSVRHKGVKVSHAVLQAAFDREVEAFMADDRTLKIFMQERGMLASDNNVRALREALSQTATTVNLETEQVAEENIDLQAVAEEMLGRERPNWPAFHGRIAASLTGIGAVVGESRVAERRAKMAAITAEVGAGPITTDVLRRKYVEMVGSADEAQGLLARWPKLKISPLAGNPEVLAELEGDLKKFVSDITVDPAQNLHDGGLCAALKSVPAILSENRLAEADWMAKLKDAVEAKIREYVDARGAHRRSVIATAGTDFAQIEAATETVFHDNLKLGDMTSLDTIDSRYTVDDAVIEQAKRDLAAAQLTAYADGIAKWIDTIQSFELSDFGFRMADLSTLTAANSNEVADYVRKNEFFKKADDMLKRAADAVAVYGDYAPADMTQRLASLTQAKDALRNPFLDKLRDVTAGGI